MASSLLRFGQINLGGSALATAELPALALQLRLDIVLLQEQYSQVQPSGPVVLQFGATPKAAIGILRKDLRAVALHHLSTSHCAVAAVSIAEMDTIYIVSAYFQYSDDIEPHILHLERVLEHLRGRKVVVGVDSNVHSPLWFSEPRHYIGRGAAAERRRQLMEDFVTARDLHIFNRAGQPMTFAGPNGESNIDVTLGSRRLVAEEWTVHDGVSTSDHRLITFNVACGKLVRKAVDLESEGGEPPRFRGTGVDWARFRNSVSERIGNLDTRKPAPVLARDFTDAVVRAAHECLGTARRRKDAGYEWWNEELDCNDIKSYILLRTG